MKIRGRSLYHYFVRGIQGSFFKEHAVEPQFRSNEVLSYQGSFLYLLLLG